MSFLNGSCDITAYRIKNLKGITGDAVRAHAIEPIDNMVDETVAYGFSSIDDILDNRFEKSVPEKGEWLCFGLRTDKRSVQGALVRKLLGVAVMNEERKNGGNPISRKQKKELKEEITDRLLRKAEPLPSFTDIAINMQSGLCFVGTSNAKQLEKVEELLHAAFGDFTASQVDVDALQQKLVTMIREDSTVEVDGESYTLAFGQEITLDSHDTEPDAEPVHLSIRNDQESVESGIEAGLSVSKIRVVLVTDDEDRKFSCTVTHDGRICGCKVPVLPKGEQNEDDLDAAFLYSMENLKLLYTVVSEVFGLGTE